MKEALKLALEALEHINDRFDLESVAQDATTAITAIKEALAQDEQWTPERIAGMARLKEAQDKKWAQPEQEPQVRTGDCLRVGVCASEGHKIQVQRPWVGLTDEQIESCANWRWMTTCRAIEAKLKEKNT